MEGETQTAQFAPTPQIYQNHQIVPTSQIIQNPQIVQPPKFVPTPQTYQNPQIVPAPQVIQTPQIIQPFKQNDTNTSFCGFRCQTICIIISLITFIIGLACVIQGYHLTAWIGIIAGICGFIGSYKQKRSYMKVFRGMLIFHAIYCIIIVIIFSSARDVCYGMSWDGGCRGTEAIIIQTVIWILFDALFIYICNQTINQVCVYFIYYTLCIS